MFSNPMSVPFVVAVCIACSLLGPLLPKKIGPWFEGILLVALLVWAYLSYPLTDVLLLFSIGASTYASFGAMFDRGKKEKQLLLKGIIEESDDVIEIIQKRNFRRMAADLAIGAAIAAGGILFLIFATEMYSVMKFMVILMLITMAANMTSRMAVFFGAKFFWLHEEEKLVILAPFQSRELPLADLKELSLESEPDILKLHPVFSFMSSVQDFTTSFSKVIRLSFPGETIYFTPIDPELCVEIWGEYDKPAANEKKVLPFWHPASFKRLICKGYFAASVKGVSAYTGLLVILILLEVQPWVITVSVLLWWVFNLWISDRLLIAANDAIEVTEGELLQRAKAIFARAKVPGTKLYLIDSEMYNGLAIGMNIGKGSVILTSATLQLPPQAVDAILAHEAIHIQKRDVLFQQLARIAFIGVLGVCTYIWFEELQQLTEHVFLLMAIIYVIMIFFPIYLSFFAQWAEVRADHFGGLLLDGGRQQMADGLKSLAMAQEKDSDKTINYSTTDQPLKISSELERSGFFFSVSGISDHAAPSDVLEDFNITKGDGMEESPLALVC